MEGTGSQEVVDITGQIEPNTTQESTNDDSIQKHTQDSHEKNENQHSSLDDGQQSLNSEGNIAEEIHKIINKANENQQHNLAASFPPSSITFPNSGLDDIQEEDKDNNISNAGNEANDPEKRLSSGRTAKQAEENQMQNPYPITLPRSNGSRSNRWHTENNEAGLPNTSSTIYSPIGPSRGVSEFDQHEQWSNSRCSQPIFSPLSSPAFSPSPAEVRQHERARLQIKNHGPVAKWLAKRQKKTTEPIPRAELIKPRKPKRYAAHIQPKVNTRNEEYSPRGGDVTPIRAEKLNWNSKAHINSHNDAYSHHESNKENNRKAFTVKSEKLHWEAKSKVEVWNTDYKPAQPKNFQVFSEKLQWYEHPKLDTKNANYSPASQNFKPTPIVDEDLNWSANSKVQTHNKDYKPPESKNFQVFHEKQQWKATPKVDSVRPHYKPTESLMKRIKSENLHWKKEAQVEPHHPRYIKGKENNTARNPRESNSFSSHSSQSDPEWYSSQTVNSYGQPSKKSPVIGKNTRKAFKSPEHQLWQSSKVLYNSKDLVDEDNEQRLSSRSYPVYKFNSKPVMNDPYSNEGITSRKSNGKPFTTYSPKESRKSVKNEKPRKLFKERVDPLPPIGTYTHTVDQPVVYPDTYYNGYKPIRSQKIEVIGMKDLSQFSKKEPYSVFIN